MLYSGMHQKALTGYMNLEGQKNDDTFYSWKTFSTFRYLAFQLPNQKRHTLDETDDTPAEVLDTGIQDTMVIESYDEAQRLISSFLAGFLKK